MQSMSDQELQTRHAKDDTHCSVKTAERACLRISEALSAHVHASLTGLRIFFWLSLLH